MTEIHFIDAPPRVFLVGNTKPNPSAFDDYLAYRKATWNTPDRSPYVPESIVEWAGRVCYHSWGNPGNKTREEYVQGGIVAHRHGSVLEHLWVNLLVADLPRSSQLELVRHGDGTAFSFESTRFTNKHLRFVVPPRFRDDPLARRLFETSCDIDVQLYTELVAKAERDHDEGTLKRKRALEAARSVLPNALGSDGMVSMNARALRWILELRSDEAADLSMREFAFAVFAAVEPVLPAVLADAVVGAPSDGVCPITFAVSKV